MADFMQTPLVPPAPAPQIADAFSTRSRSSRPDLSDAPAFELPEDRPRPSQDRNAEPSLSDRQNEGQAASESVMPEAGTPEEGRQPVASFGKEALTASETLQVPVTKPKAAPEPAVTAEDLARPLLQSSVGQTRAVEPEVTTEGARKTGTFLMGQPSAEASIEGGKPLVPVRTEAAPKATPLPQPTVSPEAKASGPSTAQASGENPKALLAQTQSAPKTQVEVPLAKAKPVVRGAEADTARTTESMPREGRMATEQVDGKPARPGAGTGPLAPPVKPEVSPVAKPEFATEPTLRQAAAKAAKAGRETLADRLNQADSRTGSDTTRLPLADRLAAPENVAAREAGKAFAPGFEGIRSAFGKDFLSADGKPLTDSRNPGGMPVAEKAEASMKSTLVEPEIRANVTLGRSGSPTGGGSAWSGFGSATGGSAFGQDGFGNGQGGGRNSAFDRGGRESAHGVSSANAEASGRSEKTFQNPTTQRAAEVVPAVMQQIERLRRSGAERLNVRLPLEGGEAIELRLRLLGGDRVQVRVGEVPESLRQSLREGWSQLVDEAADQGLQIDFQWGSDSRPNPSSRFA